MRPFGRAGTSPFVVIAPPAESGATSPPSKGPFQFGGHGNVEATKAKTWTDLGASLSDSVHTEIRLRSLLRPYVNSQGRYLVLPVTPTPGNIALANFDVTVWPAWIRYAISEKLLQAGGVRSASALQLVTDPEGNPSVLPVTNLDTSSTASPVEPVTDGDARE